MIKTHSQLLERYDRRGPRYTSYPPATEFHEGVGEERYLAHLERAGARDEPLSFYAHLPFCEERCLYCGCTTVVTHRRDVLDRYLDALYREIDAIGARLGRRPLRQLHFGGGTPTYLTPEQIRELHERITRWFRIEEGAELAVEIDPRVTTPAHLEVLAELGYRRLSLGVQDFTPEVQSAVNRVQPYTLTRDLIQRARALGFESLNVDLIHGLPMQRPETFQRTLDLLVGLRPERVAVYSYAHMPWLKGHQKKIDSATLPTSETKLDLARRAERTLRDAGYVVVGMDHFALPDDEMGRAMRDGTLWRNFMGYTTHHGTDQVAVGMSGISDVAGGFFQNSKKLVDYLRALEEGRLPIERGYVLDSDDVLRRHVVTSLMCTFRVDVPAFERRFGIDFWTAFADEREALQEMVADGLVELGPDHLTVIGVGRRFVRNVCMVFDSFLGAAAPETESADPLARGRFSRTV